MPGIAPLAPCALHTVRGLPQQQPVGDQLSGESREVARNARRSVGRRKMSVVVVEQILHRDLAHEHGR
jgi:hypothetical protein